MTSMVFAQTTLFKIDPSTDAPTPTADYLGAGYVGASSDLPERMDSATLGGTARTLARIDVNLLLFGLIGDETADIQVKLFSGFDSGAGTFVGQIWQSDIIDNALIGPTTTLYSFTPATTDIVLPDTLYYGVVLSDFQGSLLPLASGPVLGDVAATPTSDEAPAPVIPSSTFWVLNGDNTTYTEVPNNADSAVSITIVAIPEPGTFGVLTAGALLAGLLHRLRTRHT